MSGRYEGPSCSIDINECVRGTAGCAANAGCINTEGSYRCQCYFGYQGEAVIYIHACLCWHLAGRSGYLQVE